MGFDSGDASSGDTGNDDWSVAAKRRLVEESFAPGAVVGVVARRYGLSRQRLSAWRRQYRDGRLTAGTVEAREAVDFARIVVSDDVVDSPLQDGSVQLLGPVEVVFSGLGHGGEVTVRLPSGLSPASLGDVVRRLTVFSNGGTRS